MARFALLIAAALLVCAGAARLTPSDVHDISTEGLVSSLMSSTASSFQALVDSASSMLGGKKDKKGCGGPPAYVAIKFIVPPSEGADFEEAWLDLEKDVEKEEKPVVFDLKKTKMDNLMYIGYSEWESMRDLGEHLHSDHFQDFAKFADDHGVRWELELLRDMSKDIEDEQDDLEDWDSYIPGDAGKYIPEDYRPESKDRKHKGKGKRGHGRRTELSATALAQLAPDATDAQVAQLQSKLMKCKSLFHVVFVYIVSPKVREEFVDRWTDLAEEAIKVPGNRIFSLRKVAADNTKFLGYSTWSSWTDFHEFVHSKSMEKYVDSIADDNVVWFASPLIKIGHQEE
ncbi:hypothetical protein V8C86DRAFT_579512 [Haematococcus lacustris]